MPYNLTAINASGVLAITKSTNEILMFNMFGTLLLIAIAFITTSAFLANTNDWKKSVGASSLITLVIGAFFRAVNLVGNREFFLVAIFAGVAAFLMFLIKD